MFHCRLLGLLDLRREGEAMSDLLVRPRAAGLLAYLAGAARGGFARRDTLVAMFWPEHDSQRGRAALRQQLHALRAAGAEDLVVTRGQGDVGLDDRHLTCDLWDFEDALSDGALERAVECYGGPFLDGFVVRDAPGFDRWADERREALARRYVEALETLGTAAAADPRAAARWWALLLQADPYNTPAALQLMRALAAAGDRPNAVLVGDRHVTRLRQDLATTPSREFRQLHDALRLASGPGIARGGMPAPGEPPVAEPVATAVQPPAEAPARRIDRYRILRVLGEGGRGLVYEAEQTEPVWRRVALKVIRDEAHSKGLIARFEAERQALAVMDHPCIAKVLDAGATSEGHPYFVMEFVEGTPLTSYCDDRRLPTRERLALFLDLCGAVQHAHQKGVIHRDLKPSNVLVSERDGKAAPRVIDFGIAKARGLKLTDRTLATEYGTVVGTPAYMSPEQAEGAGLDVDTRTDIYSLGVMLYELLVGKLPVDPADLGVVPFIAQLALRDTNPPTPSDRVRRLNGDGARVAARRRTEVAALARELRGDLDWIVMKAIAPEREQRYSTAAALAQDLERYLRHEPVQARPPSRWYRMRKFARRNRVGVLAGALALLALVAGSIGSTVGFIQARRSARTATRSADFLASMLEFGDPSRTRGGNPTARDILNDGGKRLPSELANEPLIQARLYYVLAQANFYLGQPRTGDSQTVRGIQLYERYLGPNAPDVASGLLGLDYLRGGSAQNTDTLVTRALAIYERQPEPLRSGGVASAHINLSAHQLREGQPEEALPNLLRAVAILEAYPDQQRRYPELLYRTPRERLMHALYQLGYTYSHLHRFEDTRATWARCLAVAEQNVGGVHPDVTPALEGLAWSALYLGRYAEAESLVQRAFELRASFAGERAQLPIRYLALLGRILSEAGRYGEADSVLEIVMTGRPASSAARGALYRGNNALRQGRAYEAQLAFQRALGVLQPRTRRDSLGDDAEALSGLGEALVVQGRYREAEAVLQPTVGLFSGRDSVYWEHDRARTTLAMALVGLGRMSDAEEQFRRALRLGEMNYAATPDIVPRRDVLLRTLEAYGRFLRAEGRIDEARQMEDRATLIRGSPIS